jgi:multidrug efflux system outer membrane protein
MTTVAQTRLSRPIHGLALAASGLLAACAPMGPNYQRPPVSLPEAWLAPAQGTAAASANASAAAAAGSAPRGAAPAVAEAPPVGAADLVNTAWWKALGDPQLDALIQIALDENKDLRIAAYRIDQFDAMLQVSKSAGGPQVTVAAQRSRDTLSQNRFEQLNVNTPPVGNTYQISGAINWELDLWGRIRRADEAALAQLLASEESRRALVLTLVSNVASTYVRLLGADRDLAILRRALASREETLALLEKKYKGGGVNELPVLKARAEVEEGRADLPPKETEIKLLEHALCGLLGRNPGPIPRGRPIEDLQLPAIPGGLPADLLTQRPDVRQAEEQLIAANAEIGVAKTQYLPRIGLTAQSGFASDELSKLLELTSNFGTFGVFLLGPIFTSGRIAGQVREAEAIQRQKAVTYVLSVQTALREVEDALVANRNVYQRFVLQARQIEALQEHKASALRRYEGGRSSYLEVLEADRGIYTAELQGNETLRMRYIALIGVYKAMGGGWSVADYRPADSSIIGTAHE